MASEGIEPSSLAVITDVLLRKAGGREPFFTSGDLLNNAEHRSPQQRLIRFLIEVRKHYLRVY